MNANPLTRRSILSAIPGVAVAATLPSAANSMSSLNLPGPIVRLRDERAALLAALDSPQRDTATDQDDDPLFDRWVEIDEALIVSSPATSAEAAALVEVALIDYVQFQGGGSADLDAFADNGERLVLVALTNALRVLQRVTASA